MINYEISNQSSRRASELVARMVPADGLRFKRSQFRGSLIVDGEHMGNLYVVGSEAIIARVDDGRFIERLPGTFPVSEFRSAGCVDLGYAKERYWTFKSTAA